MSYTQKTEFGNIELNVPKVVTHLFIAFVIAFIGLNVLFGGWQIINAGQRGIVLKMGQVDRIMEPGFNWKMPFLEKVVETEVRTQKQEVQASAASKDLQIVTSNLAIQYNINPENVGLLYEEIGISYRSRIIDPAIQDSVKAVTAKFTAEQLITDRQIVSDEIEALLRVRLAEAYIIVTNVDIINFDFSASFNNAIERKVTAEQDALAEENKLKKVVFEQQQKIEVYKAEAEQTRLQNEALSKSDKFLELKKLDVQMKYAEKWDGKLPQQFVPGSAIPFINVSQ